jgi:hypothetical protein
VALVGVMGMPMEPLQNLLEGKARCLAVNKYEPHSHTSVLYRHMIQGGTGECQARCARIAALLPTANAPDCLVVPDTSYPLVCLPGAHSTPSSRSLVIHGWESPHLAGELRP